MFHQRSHSSFKVTDDKMFRCFHIWIHQNWKVKIGRNKFYCDVPSKALWRKNRGGASRRHSFAWFLQRAGKKSKSVSQKVFRRVLRLDASRTGRLRRRNGDFVKGREFLVPEQKRRWEGVFYCESRTERGILVLVSRIEGKNLPVFHATHVVMTYQDDR